MLWTSPPSPRTAGSNPGPPRPYPGRMGDEVLSENAVSPTRAAEMIEAGGVQIVDVRQGYEWEAGRISGAAHIPLDALPTRNGEIARDMTPAQVREALGGESSSPVAVGASEDVDGLLDDLGV